MKPLSTLLATIVAALVCASASNSSAQNLITNGGFETGDFTGYTVTDTDPDTTNVGPQGGSSFQGAREGTNWANLGSDPATASLSQMFSTTPGVQYTFSFSLATDSTPPAEGNFFQALFNGVPLLTLTNSAETDFNVNRGYIDFSFSNADTIASGTSSTIEFRYQHGDDFFRLDAVSVVPEPSTVSLIAISALGGLVCVYRRSRRTA